MKRAPADAEEFGRFGDVPAGLAKGLLDEALFHRLEIQVGGRGGGCAGGGLGRTAGDARGQIPHSEALSPAKGHAMLDGGAQFADIAGPVVALERLLGVGR